MGLTKTQDYSDVKGNILDPLLEMEVFRSIRTRSDWADTFRLYSNPELLKKVTSACVDRFGENYDGGIISIGEFGMPLALNLAMKYHKRGNGKSGITGIHPYLLTSESGGEIHPSFQAYKGNKVILVRHILEDGSFIREVIYNTLPRIEAKAYAVLTILDNDAEPNRELLREVLEREKELDVVSLCRASSRKSYSLF